MMKVSPPFFPARGYIEGYYGGLAGMRGTESSTVGWGGMNASLRAEGGPFHRVEWRSLAELGSGIHRVLRIFRS